MSTARATIDVKLPESLTTYRIMAVAADRASRFGANDTEVRINKPLTLKSTFPRFLAVGDAAHFGAVVTSQLKTAGQATVTIASLDPDVLEFTGGAEQTLQLAAGGSIEARFDASSKRVGQARIRMTVKMGDETDAFEDVIPVEVLTPAETVAAYGEVTRRETGRRVVAHSGERRPRHGRASRRARFDGDGGPGRRRALSRRVSIWLRRAARLANAGARARCRSW